jgi:hypothetical protein
MEPLAARYSHSGSELRRDPLAAARSGATTNHAVVPVEAITA